MMSAMEEIQDRADNIMDNIMVKEGELAKIKKQAEKAEIEKKALEEHSNKMLDEKQLLENNIGQLLEDKLKMEHEIEEQAQEVVKYVAWQYYFTLFHMFRPMLVLIGH